VPLPAGDRQVLLLRVDAERTPRPIVRQGAVHVRVGNRNARADRHRIPLEDAFRIAQTDLIGWIAAESGLDVMDAYQLMTQVSESPVANVVDPNYTFIAKVRKEYLPSSAVYGGSHLQVRELGRTYLG
jgi:acetamidase/formamidase